MTPDVIAQPGEIKIVEDHFKIKEIELKKHLKNELEKIDGNKNKNKKTGEKKSSIKILTLKELYKDAQLKEATDILEALIITKRN